MISCSSLSSSASSSSSVVAPGSLITFCSLSLLSPPSSCKQRPHFKHFPSASSSTSAVPLRSVNIYLKLKVKEKDVTHNHE